MLTLFIVSHLELISVSNLIFDILAADVAVNLDKPSVVHDVRWQTDMHYPATRKLAAQSHGMKRILYRVFFVN